MNQPHYGYWKNWAALRAAYPNRDMRFFLALMRQGQVDIGRPRLRKHETAELDNNGRWIVSVHPHLPPVRNCPPTKAASFVPSKDRYDAVLYKDLATQAKARGEK